ncbi:MAG: winged helix-turn-helix domain-containing protein [Pirellulales bacterium]
MATAHHYSCVDQIGDTAGLIWQHIHESGPLTLTQLTKDIDAPRDVILQAIGWLAREDKLAIDEEGRNKKTLSLRD